MKKIRVVIIALLTSVEIFAQTSGPFGFTWEIAPGLRNYEMIIGSDEKKVNDAYDSSERYITDTFYKSFLVHKHVVRPEIEQYILTYIAANCKRTDKITHKEDNIYFIGTYDNIAGRGISCIITDQKEAIKFFAKLNKWIEISPYKKECKYIIADIQKKFIEGKEFALTPNQEKLKQELEKKEKKKVRR